MSIATAEMTEREPHDESAPSAVPAVEGPRKPGDARQLRESDLRVILESTTDGILAVDDRGTTIAANRRFAEMWQITQPILDTADDDAMLGLVLDQLVDPDALLNQVKAELWRHTLRSGFDGFAHAIDRWRSPQKSGTTLASAVLYATQ